MRPLHQPAAPGASRSSGTGRWAFLPWQALVLLPCLTGAQRMRAQVCTTQAHMSQQQRAEIGGAAYSLATAVAAGDAGRVRATTVTPYAGDPEQVAALVRSMADPLRGDQLAVTQLYLLDASGRGGNETNATEFACALAGATAETDFVIGGLPPGRFAFAMVEAKGAQPWVLPFLLQQQGGTWKMAGFYPHARLAAGHDGLWYWTTARADAKANKPWLSWLFYGEADQLLRPATFVSSGNLDKLRAEQRSAAPEGLAAGVNRETPLSIKGTDGSVYRISSLETDGAAGEGLLNLTLHLEVPAAAPTPEAATERNLAAARALFRAHPELIGAFSNVWVIAEAPGGTPFTTERPVSTLLAGTATP